MKHTVLIVDDVPENVDILSSILKEEYDIKATTNGMTALRIAEKFKPDIILLDVMMPGMDGYEVCKRLKENPMLSQIPVIFVTAMTEAKDEVKGFSVGAVDYVTKPISPAIVKARVRNHLALSDQNIALDFQVRQKTEELEKSRIDLIQRLSLASEYKDTETGEHLLRVSKYSQSIARACDLSIREIDLIELASPMHDVGKIGIPDVIVQKPGRYTDEEYEIMKKHTLIGKEILGSHTDPLLSAASIMAEQHHERWNGTGYPNGRKEREIHLYARIIAIADVFDALTSKRVYKEAWSFEESFNQILQQAGVEFDPFVVRAFEANREEILEIYNKYRD